MIPSKNGVPLPSQRWRDVQRFIDLYPQTTPAAQEIFKEIFNYYSAGGPQYVQFFPYAEWLPFNLRTRFHPIGNTSELAAVHIATKTGEVKYAVDRHSQVDFDTDFFWKGKKCSVKTGIVDRDNYLVYGLAMHGSILNSLSDHIWFMDNEINQHVCINTRSLQKNMVHCMMAKHQKKIIIPLERLEVISQGKYLDIV